MNLGSSCYGGSSDMVNFWGHDNVCLVMDKMLIWLYILLLYLCLVRHENYGIWFLWLKFSYLKQRLKCLILLFVCNNIKQ